MIRSCVSSEKFTALKKISWLISRDFWSITKYAVTPKITMMMRDVAKTIWDLTDLNMTMIKVIYMMIMIPSRRPPANPNLDYRDLEDGMITI